MFCFVVPVVVVMRVLYMERFKQIQVHFEVLRSRNRGIILFTYTHQFHSSDTISVIKFDCFTFKKPFICMLVAIRTLVEIVISEEKTLLTNYLSVLRLLCLFRLKFILQTSLPGSE